MMGSAELNQERVLQTLYDVVGRDNSLSRCCAVKALERVDGRRHETRKRLIGLLLDPDPDVRSDAAAALGRMRVAEATEALLYNLENDPDGEVRIEAVKALSGIGSPSAVEPLIRCLQADGYPDLDDADMADEMTYASCWEVHSQTLDALGRLGDARATESVIALLENDDYADLQESGFRVLAQLNSDRARAFLLEQLEAGGRLARRRAARALTSLPQLAGAGRDLLSEIVIALTNALMDPDPGVRIYAAQAVAASNNPLVTVPLTMLLADSDTEVRTEVTSLLGKMRGREVVERLRQLLAESTPKLKRRVVHVLGEIGDRASLVSLIPLLETEDDDLLYEVVGAIGRIGVPGTEDRIAAILADEKVHFSARVQAAKALGHLLENGATTERREETIASASDSADEKASQELEFDPRAILIRSVFDEHDAVSQAALSALVQIDRGAVAATLVGFLRGDVSCAAQPDQTLSTEADGGLAASTRTVGDEESAPPASPEAIEGLVAGHDATTSTLAAMLSRPAEQATVPTEAADSPLPGTPRDAVRILAARLLGGLPAPGSAAVQALIESFDGRDAALRKEVLVALGRIGAEEAVTVIREGLQAEELEVRLVALEALGEFPGASEADDLLVRLLEDPDPYLRQRVVQALGRVKSPASLKHISRMLGDTDRDVCRAALRALSEEMNNEALSERIVGLMFAFSGELKNDAAAALRRLNEFERASRLLAMLNDPNQEEFHWICIDALAEMFSQDQGRQVD